MSESRKERSCRLQDKRDGCGQKPKLQKTIFIIKKSNVHGRNLKASEKEV